MHRSEGLLGCYHRLEHGSRSCYIVHAALYGVEPQTCDSSEDMAFWHLRLGHIVSGMTWLIRKIAVADEAWQGLCRRINAHHYD